MVSIQQPMRTIGIQVTQKVDDRLQALAKGAGMPKLTYVSLLFDAAYASKVKGTPDASLDAQVALVGLATLSDADLEPIAEAAGLEIAVAQRMREGWRSVLDERRRGAR